MNTRTGDRLMNAVTHVGCSHCGTAVPVTSLNYWKESNGKVKYFCSAGCSLESEQRERKVARAA